MIFVQMYLFWKIPNIAELFRLLFSFLDWTTMKDRYPPIHQGQCPNTHIHNIKRDKAPINVKLEGRGGGGRGAGTPRGF